MVGAGLADAMVGLGVVDTAGDAHATSSAAQMARLTTLLDDAPGEDASAHAAKGRHGLCDVRSRDE